jgi:hypothetical protein
MNYKPQNKNPHESLVRVAVIIVQKALFDFGFLELHMLAYDGVVLVQLKLGGLRARILFGHIEVTSVRGRDKLDLNNVRFGHDIDLQSRAYALLPPLRSSPDCALAEIATSRAAAKPPDSSAVTPTGWPQL